MEATYTITAGDSLTRFIGAPHPSRSITVDNPTAQWIHVLDTSFYVPPSTVGVTKPLDGGPQVGLEWAAPPGVTQPASVAGQQATATYWDTPQPPSSGIVIAVSVPAGVEITKFPTI